jgi:hypothetical protein
MIEIIVLIFRQVINQKNLSIKFAFQRALLHRLQ